MLENTWVEKISSEAPKSKDMENVQRLRPHQPVPIKFMDREIGDYPKG